MTGDSTARRRNRARRAGSLTWGMVAAAMVLAAGACSGGDDAGARESSSATSARNDGRESDRDSAEAAGSVEEEIAARYKGYWEARFAANSPPDPDDPALREYATGEQLAHVVRETQENLDDGLAFRRAEAPADFQRVEVIELSGDAAVVQECVVSDAVVYHRDTGEVVDDSVSTYNVRGDMRLVDGEWRLARATAVQRWDGVAGCALAG